MPAGRVMVTRCTMTMVATVIAMIAMWPILFFYTFTPMTSMRAGRVAVGS